MSGRLPELLSPAGSPAALAAAVSGGADAVYLGCSEFANARMNAENFNKQTLSEAIDFCHSRNVKTYITVNTLLHDRELEGLFSYASFLYENGADGVIVQDLGVADFLRRAFPRLPIHASTQMGVCNSAGVAAAREMGCTRAVAARELSFDELRTLCREPTEIEVFVRGALCACYSGFCLMSSMIGQRSGNRGKCAQPCRLPYRIDQKKPALLMSLKDLNLLTHLNTLSQMGVASLKIEGRMKGPDYVGTVTSIYRRALDGEPVTPQMTERLRAVFDRGGDTDGYQTGRGNMFAYTRPATPYHNIPPFEPAAKKIPIGIEAELGADAPLSVRISDGSECVGRAEGVTPAFAAQNRPITQEVLTERLSRLGDTPYTASRCDLSLSDGLMIPLGEIARTRREALERFTAQKIASFHRDPSDGRHPDRPTEGVSFSKLRYTAAVNTIAQYHAIEDLFSERIALPLSEILSHPDEADPRRITVRLPHIAHESERAAITARLSELRRRGFTDLLFGNIGDFVPEWVLHGDLTLWIYNSRSAAVAAEKGAATVFLSPELNEKQIASLRSPVPCEALLYGRLPLMTSRHCFVSSARGTCRGTCGLTDRTGAFFPTRCVNGMHLLYNSVPVYLGDRTQHLANTAVAFGRLEFTVESPEQCRAIALTALSGQPLGSEFTRGHYFRGV